jgi:hypothetical protein
MGRGIFMNNKTSSMLNMRIIILSLSSLVLSLVILFISDTQMIQNLQFKWISILLQTIATTLMVAGTIGLIFQFITTREMMKAINVASITIEKQFKVFKNMSEMGLVDVYYNNKDFSFDEILLNSRLFIAIMNDGRRWIGNHYELLRRRMLTPNLKTIFILQHPKSEMIQILARKMECTPNFLCEKIQGTVKELFSFEKDSNHELGVYGHQLFNVYALFISEEFAAFTPYYISFGRRSVPIFVFQKQKTESQYDIFYNDYIRLLEFSEKFIPEVNKDKKLAIL